jgi:predicted Fe-Mo cluster-binding NifX family protein
MLQVHFKGGILMRVAISTDGDYVSEHFGRCPNFTILDLEKGKVIERKSIDNPGHSPGFIPQFMNERGVKLIICGGMGARASGMFEELGIETIAGVSGKINDVISKLEKGTLEGGESLCKPGAGRGYGVEKTVCDHPHED